MQPEGLLDIYCEMIIAIGSASTISSYVPYEEKKGKNSSPCEEDFQGKSFFALLESQRGNFEIIHAITSFISQINLFKHLSST